MEAIEVHATPTPASTFPFPSLIQDLQQLIAHFYLDKPSLLSLSVTSRQSRELFWAVFTSSGGYDSWATLDECCRLGYLSLLKYFYEAGASIDLWALDTAVEAQQVQVAEWLYATLSASTFSLDTTELFHKLCKKAALSGNNALIQLLYPQDNSLNRVCYLLQGGFVDLAFDYIRQVPRNDPYVRHFGLYGLRFVPNIYHSSGVGGKLLGIPKVLTLGGVKIEPILLLARVQQILSGAYESASFEVIQYLTSAETTIIPAHPIKIDYGRLIRSKSFLLNFRQFVDGMPGFKAELMSRIKDFAESACKLASLEALKGLHEYGYIFTESDIKTIMGNSSEVPVEERVSHYSKTLACSEYLYSLGVTSWSRAFLEAPARWATYAQLKWLLEHTNDNAHVRFSILGSALQARLDRPKLALLQSLEAIFDELDLAICSFHVNNIDLCEWILDNRPHVDKKLTQLEFNRICNFLADTLGRTSLGRYPSLSGFLEKSPLFYKVRTRSYNSLALLRFFLKRGFSINSECLNKLRSVPNTYFQTELTQLLNSSAEATKSDED